MHLLPDSTDDDEEEEDDDDDDDIDDDDDDDNDKKNFTIFPLRLRVRLLESAQAVK